MSEVTRSDIDHDPSDVTKEDVRTALEYKPSVLPGELVPYAWLSNGLRGAIANCEQHDAAFREVCARVDLPVGEPFVDLIWAYNEACIETVLEEYPEAVVWTLEEQGVDGWR